MTQRCTIRLDIVIAAGFSIALSGCDRQDTGVASHEMLNATLWRQSSAEYLGNALQIYRFAAEELDQALDHPQWTAALEQTGDYETLPPAIILDLDETVLDNTTYEVRIIRRLEQYSRDSFADWCREMNAPAIPGVREFLDHAVARDVAVFYYSTRRESLRDCTTRNLRELGLPFPDASRLLLNDGTSKSEYRRRIAQHYRILLLVGDNLEDFVDGSRVEPRARRALARRYAERWGRQWIVLPNPIYGHWESSAYGFDYQLPRAQQLRLKLLQLQEE